MRTIKVEITNLDDTKSVYEVRMALEIPANLEGSIKTYLAMSRLSDGEIGYIPINTIKGWRVLTEGKGA